MLPGAIRTKLGLHPGDSLGVELEGGRIVLTPLGPSRYSVRIETDPVTGLAVAVAEDSAPMLTSEDVAILLADFP